MGARTDLLTENLSQTYSDISRGTLVQTQPDIHSQDLKVNCSQSTRITQPILTFSYIREPLSNTLGVLSSGLFGSQVNQPALTLVNCSVVISAHFNNSTVTLIFFNMPLQKTITYCFLFVLFLLCSPAATVQWLTPEHCRSFFGMIVQTLPETLPVL